MLAPDDTTKYESTLRRSSGISRYSDEVTPTKRRFVLKVFLMSRKPLFQEIDQKGII